MFTKIKKQLIQGSFLAVLSLAFSITAYGDGAGSSGGGDNPSPEVGSSWFLGAQRTIHVCFEVSPLFGVSKEKAVGDFEKGLDIWRAYIAQKHISPLDGMNLPEYQWATKVSVREGCDHTEDLALYFGVENDEVKKHREKYDNPTGFAVRLAYDKTQMWGKGFLWFANQGQVAIGQLPLGRFPNWSAKNNLLAMILHELGHVFGCEHVQQTIMRSDISNLLTSNDNQATMKSSIDHRREVFHCRNCAINAETDVAGGSPTDRHTPIKFVTKITNWEPQQVTGRDGITYLEWPKISLIRPQENESYQFEIKSETLDPVSFVLNITSDEIDRHYGPQVFKTTTGFTTYKIHSSGALYGYMKAADGTKLSVILEINRNTSAPYVLSEIIDGERIEVARFLALEPDPLP